MHLSIKRPFSACRHNGTAGRWSRMIGHPLDEARWAEAAPRRPHPLRPLLLPDLVPASGPGMPGVRSRPLPALNGQAQNRRNDKGNNNDLAPPICGRTAPPG